LEAQVARVDRVITIRGNEVTVQGLFQYQLWVLAPSGTLVTANEK
jgi:hypothetical protein